MSPDVVVIFPARAAADAAAATAALASAAAAVERGANQLCRRRSWVTDRAVDAGGRRAEAAVRREALRRDPSRGARLRPRPPTAADDASATIVTIKLWAEGAVLALLGRPFGRRVVRTRARRVRTRSPSEELPPPLGIRALRSVVPRAPAAVVAIGGGGANSRVSRGLERGGHGGAQHPRGSASASPARRGGTSGRGRGGLFGRSGAESSAFETSLRA